MNTSPSCTTYEYCHPDGTLAYQVVARDVMTADGRTRQYTYQHCQDGTWIHNLAGVPRLLYNLPGIVHAERVFFVGNEETADMLISLGYVATCVTHQSAIPPWERSYTEALQGKEVILLPDNDTLGETYAGQTYAALVLANIQVFFLRLPGLDNGEGPYAWFHRPEVDQDLFDALVEGVCGHPHELSFKETITQQQMQQRSVKLELERQKLELRRTTEERRLTQVRAEPSSALPEVALNLTYRNKPQDTEDPESWRSSLLVDREGIPRETVANCRLLLQHSAFLQDLSWDTFESLPYRGNLPTTLDTLAYEAADMLQSTYRYACRSVETLRNTLSYCIQEHASRDSLADWITSLTWDQTPRLGVWFPLHVSAEDTPYTRWLGRMLICSLAARALDPGCQQRYMVILEGAENAGKSKLCSVLGAPWTQAAQADIGSRDFLLALAGTWLLELEELDKFSRAEEATVKAMLTRTEDKFVKKFSNDPTSRKRRVVCVGTVNPSAQGYLRGLRKEDDTRYFPVHTRDDIQLEQVAAMRDQLFAEAVAWIQAGAEWWHIPAPVLILVQAEREQRQHENVYERDLERWLISRKANYEEEVFHISEALTALDIPRSQWTRGIEMAVGRALAHLHCVRVGARVIGDVPEKRKGWKWEG